MPYEPFNHPRKPRSWLDPEAPAVVPGMQSFPLLQACRLKAGLEPLPDDHALSAVLLGLGFRQCFERAYRRERVEAVEAAEETMAYVA